MSRRSFEHRAETFGLETPESWALPALRLLFHAPRVYEPLAAAWEDHFPGTLAALSRLVDAGFVGYQGPVAVDVRARTTTTKTSRRLARYRVTAKGARLVAEATVDLRVLERTFPKTSTRNAQGVLALLTAFDVDDAYGRFGLSVPHATEMSGLADRSARWWVRRLVEMGYLKSLPARLADRREVIPAHWRVTRLLCRQLLDVLDAYPAPHGALRAEFRLKRTRFLSDIDPARVGLSGATDYDHDIEAQRILAAMLRSEHALPKAVFDIEPRIVLPVDDRQNPPAFSTPQTRTAFYQPDAILTERHATTVRSVLEYERFQSRRDAWSHIERFLGYLSVFTLPFEGGVLRFVVDSDTRRRSYVQLIEAFADYAMEHPDRMPGNEVTLAVSSVERVRSAADPLDPRAWTRIILPGGQSAAGVCRLHDTKDSPYDSYFMKESGQ